MCQFVNIHIRYSSDCTLSRGCRIKSRVPARCAYVTYLLLKLSKHLRTVKCPMVKWIKLHIYIYYIHYETNYCFIKWSVDHDLRTLRLHNFTKNHNLRQFPLSQTYTILDNFRMFFNLLPNFTKYTFVTMKQGS